MKIATDISNQKVMRYLFPLLILISCNGPKEKILHKYENGRTSVDFYYPNGYDESKFHIRIYYPSGKIERELLVDSGFFVDKIKEYSESGKTLLLDSLTEPCDTLTRACSAIRTTFYENGKVAERYILKNGKYEGFSQHYDMSGILVKEYTLTKDTIKNGEYREYDTLGKLHILSTYSNNNLVGNTYFFNAKGDTIKYYNNEDGQMTLPYKKWLKDGRVLTLTYVSKDRKYVLWTWYKNEVRMKSKLVKTPENIVVTVE